MAEYLGWLQTGELHEHYQVLDHALAWLHQLVPIYLERGVYSKYFPEQWGNNVLQIPLSG